MMYCVMSPFFEKCHKPYFISFVLYSLQVLMEAITFYIDISLSAEFTGKTKIDPLCFSFLCYAYTNIPKVYNNSISN